MHPWKLAASALLAIALAAGCSAGGGGDDVPNDGPVTITYWTFIDPNQDNPRAVALKTNLEAFAEANPDIRVDLQVVAYSDLLARLPQTAATGTTPDVTMMFSPMVPQMTAAGVFNDMTGHSSDVPQDDWLQPWDSTVVDGEKVVLPYEHRVGILIYNQRIFDELGLQIPTSYDELVTAARTATDAGYTGFGAGIGDTDNSSFVSEMFANWMTQIDQPIFDDSGRAVFDTPEVEGFFRLFGDLMADGSLGGNLVDGTSATTMDAMVAGNTAMTIIGSHQFKGGEQRNPDLAWARIPGIEPGQGTAAIMGWTIGMGSSTDHPEAAWRFIEFMTSPQAQVTIASGGEVPSRLSTLDDPYFAEPDQAYLLELARNVETSGRPVTYPVNWLKMSNAIAHGLQEMYLNGVSASDAMARAVEESNAN